MDMIYEYAKAIEAHRAWDFVGNNLDQLTKDEMKEIIYRLMEEIEYGENAVFPHKATLQSVADTIYGDLESEDFGNDNWRD